MIRIAREEDLNSVMEIVQETVEDLQKEDNSQWSDEYPKKEDFMRDVKNKELYIYESDCIVSGFICINYQEDEAYANVQWRKGDKALVIHRFAVKKSKQRKKIGTKLMKFAEKFALNKGVYYIKVDTNSRNSRMNSLFTKMNYKYVGEITLRNLEAKFNCYDKIIEKENEG